MAPTLAIMQFLSGGPSLSNPHHGGRPAEDSTGKGEDSLLDPALLSCWPQRPTHLASLVGGTRRVGDFAFVLVSAGGGDTEL